MMDDQAQLPGMPTRPRGGEWADLNGIFPPNVWPTRAIMLHERGNFLFIHTYPVGVPIPPEHDRMWRSLSNREGIDVLLNWAVVKNSKQADPSKRHWYLYYLDGAPATHEPQKLEPGLMGLGTFHHEVDLWWRSQKASHR